jgi:hypothetical protein
MVADAFDSFIRISEYSDEVIIQVAERRSTLADIVRRNMGASGGTGVESGKKAVGGRQDWLATVADKQGVAAAKAVRRATGRPSLHRVNSGEGDSPRFLSAFKATQESVNKWSHFQASFMGSPGESPTAVRAFGDDDDDDDDEDGDGDGSCAGLEEGKSLGRNRNTEKEAGNGSGGGNKPSTASSPTPPLTDDGTSDDKPDNKGDLKISNKNDRSNMAVNDPHKYAEYDSVSAFPTLPNSDGNIENMFVWVLAKLSMQSYKLRFRRRVEIFTTSIVFAGPFLHLFSTWSNPLCFFSPWSWS